MGVYIKGMEMPIDGNETIIRIQPDGTVLDQYGHHLATTAVPVPPHGDLIDRKVLMRHKGDCYDADGHLLYAVVTGNILRAHTIIPAEEGET